MGISKRFLVKSVLVPALVAGAVSAAPKLRLSSSTIGPVSIAVGTAGPTRTVDATNAGDGTLRLTLASNVTWIVPTLDAPRPCSLFGGGGTCQAVRVALQTTSLAQGLFTGIVTVSDPDAIDAPQTITVTVQIGGGVPDRIDLYTPPNGSTDSYRINTNSILRGTPTTQSGGNWLSFVMEGSGTFAFTIPFRIIARHQSGMTVGTYQGSMAVAGSALAVENKTVAVTYRVTNDPIAQLSEQSLRIRLAQGGPAQVRNIAVSNRGSGTLTLSAPSAATQTGGGWLSAALVGTSVVSVTADAGSLAPGTYRGSVTIPSNAANGAQTVPVEFEVVSRGAPLAYFQGAVNNATFLGDDVLGQGVIAAVFGEQFLMGPPVQATATPLPTNLGNVRVLVNDQPAPLYFVSYGQINFQLPYNTPAGDAVVRVERDGQRGNPVSIRVGATAPRLLRLGIGDYGIIVNQDGTFPIPATPGLASRPARTGEALVIYAIGLGQTLPVVQSGAAAPLDPLGRVVPPPDVIFSMGSITEGELAVPLYVGLTPNFVGLYQINAIVPPRSPRGPQVEVYLQDSTGVAISNKVHIAVQ